MLSHLFLGISLIGAEWVLYLLVGLSILSVTLIFERTRFYRDASKGLQDFRAQIRAAASSGKYKEAAQIAESRAKTQRELAQDLEAEMALILLGHGEKSNTEVLNEIASDPVMRAKLGWEKNLSVLATIGSNAPFVGLFGTVLGIIKAFHDLSAQGGGGAGASTVTAGISEALVATAVGLIVAIPAVVAYNLFQRRVKAAITEAEAMKSFLIGKLSNGS
ncbi:MAG: MotA/TolQ/ExbB proton channel family protein [Bdellovibrionota bacterium]